MPELPEVESARRVIEDGALGRRVVRVDDSDTYVCRPRRPGEIDRALRGRRLEAVHRRGKLMWCETSGRRTSTTLGPLLSIHLGMSGRIVVTDGGRVGAEGGDDQSPDRATWIPKPEWYRFTLTFDDGGELRLLDPRRLGRVRLDPDLDALGPDAGEIGREEFRARVGRGSAPIKARLLDQATLAGVGNLLADETLWQSRLDPRRAAGVLTVDELDELRRQLRKALRLAIRRGGVHTGEIIEHRTHGGLCPRCGTPMKRATIASRTTWWCPQEQL